MIGRSFAEGLVLKLPPRLHATARQFMKFVVTGSIGAVIDFGTYNILSRVVGWDTIFYVAGYEVIAANVVSVLTTICLMFFVNKYWTFRNTEAKVVQQGLGYFSLNFVTFLLNQVLTSFFAFRVPLVALIFASQKDNAAKALAIGIILFINFAGSKFLIFRRKEQSQSTFS